MGKEVLQETDQRNEGKISEGLPPKDDSLALKTPKKWLFGWSLVERLLGLENLKMLEVSISWLKGFTIKVEFFERK